ncbi:hypothetical protein [Acanthamoeba polyphaga mimivirus]|uniref:Uncharacterized protein n=1 Tax=Acanthamoeba polyphaga mimivirus TaxID=212035 RepID=A0A2L2DI87_MIMIV|nr:hypothetical protein [Acanthamoeba polyphaga mimivirus]
MTKFSSTTMNNENLQPKISVEIDNLWQTSEIIIGENYERSIISLSYAIKCPSCDKIYKKKNCKIKSKGIKCKKCGYFNKN